MSTAHNDGAERRTATTGEGPVSYLDAGPATGPPVVLVHGWPATALTWTPQITALAAAGYRVIAPDMRGYGRSFTPQLSSAYAVRHLVADLASLLRTAGRASAMWIGHDWGAAVAWALAAHHPQLCNGVAGLVVPYRTLERGWPAMLPHVNRDVYPENQFPFAQFDYMAYYEQNFDDVTKLFDSAPDRLVRTLYRPGDPDIVSTRSPRSTVTADGGWFGGAAALPDTPRDAAILSDPIYTDLVESLTRNGFHGPNSYYLNHRDNHRYSDESVHGGALDMPALFIEAQYDPTADTIRSTLAEPMRRYCSRLEEVSLLAGHWVGLERPAEVNAALIDWLHSITGAHP
jgi:soluble epoxide hydrolase / lipid-phosphate phosphatase